jgi:hypothetical protein
MRSWWMEHHNSLSSSISSTGTSGMLDPVDTLRPARHEEVAEDEDDTEECVKAEGDDGEACVEVAGENANADEEAFAWLAGREKATGWTTRDVDAPLLNVKPTQWGLSVGWWSGIGDWGSEEEEEEEEEYSRDGVEQEQEQ